jgi:phospholipase/carboxylesterase
LLKPSAQALIRLVDEYASSVGVEALRFDLMGFSQGAALVNVIAALYPNRIGKMGVLAGFIPSGMDEILAAKPFEGKRVFVAHGAHDQLVPVERARASMDALERAGAQIVYCEDEVGHKVGANCLRALEEYLEE